MAEQDVLMTLEGLQQKEEELEVLRTVRRKEVAARIKQAIEFGDISENSEYEDAKNEQAFIEGQIHDLEKMLKNARIIDSNSVSDSIISEYSNVEVLELDTGESMRFQIVGSVEVKPFEGKISNESPIGAALLGHTVGDEVDITVPMGVMHLRVLDIEK